MKKNIALALLLSILSIGMVHAMDGDQSGAFPSSDSGTNSGLSYPNQQYDQRQPADPYGQYTGYVGVLHPVGIVPFPVVVAQPSSQATQTDSHKITVNVKCCVAGDNCCRCVAGKRCCRCTSNGDDECDVSPWVNAALNLFTCGRDSADEDPSARQLRELQSRNRDMRPATALFTAGPRVVTKEHKE